MPSADEIFAGLMQGAREEAAELWEEAKEFSINTCWSLASQLALVGRAFVAGEFTKAELMKYLETIRLQFIATLAAAIMKVEGLAERMVNAALTAVRDAINSALGFKLIA